MSLTITNALIPAAYLIGSLPTAYIVARQVANIDITEHGSGNVGGTNALRVLGRGPGIAVAITDVLKGLLPTLWAQQIFGGNTWQTLLVALAAIIGHNYSIYLKFRGGKGIATTIGVSLVLFPQAIVPLVLLAVGVVLITRYVSLASITLVSALPVFLVIRGATRPEIYFAIALALLGIYRHRSNIERLLKGTENKLGSKK